MQRKRRVFLPNKNQSISFDSKNIMAQKGCVFMIYLCTFSHIILFISRDKDKSPYSSRLREGFKYRETTFINSVRCATSTKKKRWDILYNCWHFNIYKQEK